MSAEFSRSVFGQRRLVFFAALVGMLLVATVFAAQICPYDPTRRISRMRWKRRAGRIPLAQTLRSRSALAGDRRRADEHFFSAGAGSGDRFLRYAGRCALRDLRRRDRHAFHARCRRLSGFSGNRFRAGACGGDRWRHLGRGAGAGCGELAEIRPPCAQPNADAPRRRFHRCSSACRKYNGWPCVAAYSAKHWRADPCHSGARHWHDDDGACGVVVSWSRR